MTDETLMEVMTALFTAANRNLGQTELALWREALSDLRDDVALEAARLLVREQNLWERPPTPAGLREVARGLSARRREVETDDRALPPGADAAKSRHGWTVVRRCGECDGSGWLEVDQLGSHMAVIACQNCDGTGRGNDLPPPVTAPDVARDRLAELRAVLAEKPIVKRVP